MRRYLVNFHMCVQLIALLGSAVYLRYILVHFANDARTNGRRNGITNTHPDSVHTVPQERCKHIIFYRNSDCTFSKKRTTRADYTLRIGPGTTYARIVETKGRRALTRKRTFYLAVHRRLHHLPFVIVDPRRHFCSADDLHPVPQAFLQFL